jgi:hypothetical protein
VASAPKLCPKGATVELKKEIVVGKEGEGGRPATNILPTSHDWPPLKPYFHLSLHLAHSTDQKHQK